MGRKETHSARKTNWPVYLTKLQKEIAMYCPLNTENDLMETTLESLEIFLTEHPLWLDSQLNMISIGEEDTDSISETSESGIANLPTS